MINEGTVIRTTGSSYIVLTDEGETRECFIKGKFRIEGIKSTNPVAIGDKVHFIGTEDNDHCLIDRIFPRENCIVRKSTKLSKQTHVIAANIDRAFLIVSAREPVTDTAFIDRFLVTANAYNVPTAIVMNKTDIYDDEAMEYAGFLLETYTKIGYEIFLVSAREGTGMKKLQEAMEGKTVLLSGNSGTGKSTIINKLVPGVELKTGEISQAHSYGKHTTTFAQMIIHDRLRIIDTPGIKSFGMVDFKPEELALYFPEMKEKLSECKYYNCTHTHEPGCAIKEAVENGEISSERYANYLKMLSADDMMDDAPLR